jgi:hygromycin-B 7''-O-kinase
MDGPMDDILDISEPEFARRFREPAFGLALAEIVRARHQLPAPLTRHIEGSSLVFRIGDGRWLKLTPPFCTESFDAELRVARAVEGQLPVPVPTILQTGEIDGWRYIVSARVPGVQLQRVISDLTKADFAALAVDLGDFMACFHRIRIAGFHREFGHWSSFLERNIRDAAQIHRSRGNPAAWASQIAALLKREQERLVRLGPPILVHGDLTPEHVMLHRVSGRWRLSGVLDLADAMLAPAELDVAVPMLDIFRGRGNLQRSFLRATGISPTAEGESFSFLFMAIALLHPFAYFHDWFDAEIEQGLCNICDIARSAFPDCTTHGDP